MKRITFAFFGLIFTVMVCPAQKTAPSESQTAQKMTFRKVVSERGWSLPVNEEKEKLATRKSVIDNYPVEIRFYKLNKPFDMQLNQYALNSGDNSLWTSYYDIEVRGFSEYLAEGKLFAYKIEGVVFGINEDGGGKVYAGAVLTRYYTDEDGDGKFETYYTYGLLNKIPVWIKKDETKMIKPLQKPPQWKPPSANAQ